MRPGNIPAAIALVVILVAAYFADQQNRSYELERLRSDVLAQVSVIRAKLEGNINGNLQLVRGLVGAVSIEPDVTQERFEALAGRLIDQRSEIRSIAAAPDLVVSMTYPFEANGAVIGLDYRNNPVQREAALRARDLGELVLAGPVDLIQGGQGFVGRFPVFVEEPGGRRFWGLIAAVIDLQRLYKSSGIDDADIDIAITGRDALGEAGERFYGDAETVSDSPVLASVGLPTGSWQIAARPRGGWVPPAERIATARLYMVAAAILILVPIIMAGRLMDERQRYISVLRKRESDLEGLSHRLGLALETSRIGVWDYHVRTRQLFWDDRMNEIYGYPAWEGPCDRSHWSARLHPDDRARAERDFRDAIETQGRYYSDFRILLDGGEVRHIRANGIVYQDAADGLRIVGVNWDVSADVALNEDLRHSNILSEARNAELEAAKARIEYNALHDSLTGLPNRRFLDDVLTAHVEMFGAGERAGLLQVDLDRFKQINDTLGHAAGDAMLVHVSHVLRSVVDKRDFVARIGGDEFVILVTRQPGEPMEHNYLAHLASKVVEAMREPVTFDGHACRLGVSVGIACDGDMEADPSRLLINADMALYRAKDKGRNRFQFFNDALQDEIIHTKRIADDILSGLERGEFVVHYQPQFSAVTHEVVGVEALARWNHPAKGLLAPNTFLRVAEELNVVATIDRIVLEQTLRDLKVWRKAGLDIPKASVNVSARRLRDEELIGNLGRLAIEPNMIAFELVESIFLDEQDELLAWNVDRIKEFGIDIEIDDFGTGYASIVSLMKLKPSRLKIDRQLVMPIVRSARQRQLVGSIIDIGKALGIQVLAEGVETMDHARVLGELGCDALQGYAFARPMPAPDLQEFVLARRWRAAS